MNKLPENIDLIAFIVLLAIGLFVLIINFIHLRKGLKTKKWKLIKGKILSSEVEISQSPTKKSFDNYYKAKIIYEYDFLGKKQTSDKVFIGDTVYGPHKRKFERIVKKFVVNTEVDVFINPENTDESVLMNGPKSNVYENHVLGIVLIILGFYIKINFEVIRDFLENL